MGGTVLDMFTLGATPFSLSLSILFQRGGKGRGRYNPRPSVLPTSASFTFQFLFSPPFSNSPVSSFSFLSFFLFFPYFHEFSQKRHANTRALDDRPITLTEEAAARNF